MATNTAQLPAGHFSTASGSDGLRIWSCVTCRRRKVRCDRRDPCANCTRQNIDCHFPVTGRLPRRRPPPTGSASGSAAHRQSELLNRLRRLEAVVTELGAQIEDGAKETGFSGGSVSLQIPTSRPLDDGAVDAPRSDTGEVDSQNDSRDEINLSLPEIDEDFGRLVIAKDGSLQVGNRFWTVFCDEVDNIFRAVEDVDDVDEEGALAPPVDPTPSGSDQASSSGHQSFVLGGGRHIPVEDLYPQTSQRWFLWETYKTNIDPFIKVLDISDVDQMMREAGQDTHSRKSETEALIFSISFAAVASLEDEEFESHFGMPKSQLLTKHQLATEIALARAEYLTTQSLMTVQAFVIYLSILPHVGAGQMARPLTGLLVKLAISMQLHHDGSYNAQTTPREVEIRRRLWWQVCFLDSRSKDPRFPYTMITEEMFDTALPSFNEQLDSTAGTDTGDSSIAICILSCKIWKLVRTVEKMKHTNRNFALHYIRTVRREVDVQLLHKLENNGPLKSLTCTLADLVFAKMEMTLHKKPSASRSAGTGHEESSMFDSALVIIRSVLVLKTRHDWKGWRWQIQGNVPWHAFGVVLRHVLVRPWDELSEEAWLPTKTLFGVISGEPQNEKIVGGGMWKQLSKMVARVDRQKHTPMISYSSTDTSWDMSSGDWPETVASMPSLNRTTDEIDDLARSTQEAPFSDYLGGGLGAVDTGFPSDIMDWSSTWDDFAAMPWF